MALSINFRPGIQLNAGDEITEEVLNLLANPTILLEGTIATQAIGDNTLTEPKFVAQAVSTRALADACVTAAKIAAQAVVEAAMANASVSNRALVAGAVTVDKLSSGLQQNFGSDGKLLSAYDPISQQLAAQMFT